MSEPIVLNVVYTPQDYQQAQALYQSRPVAVGKTINTTPYLLLVVVIGVLLFLLPQLRNGDLSRAGHAALWNMLSLLLMAGLFIGFWLYLMRASVTVNVDKQDDAATPPRRNWGWLIRLVIFLALIGGLVYLGLQGNQQPHTPIVRHSRISDDVLWNAVSMVVMAALFIGFWLFIMRKAQHGVKNDENHTLTFREEEMQIQTPTLDTRFLWSRFTRVLENNHLFLLVNDQLLLLHLVPKRAIPDADTEAQLRELLERKFGPVNTARPAISQQNTPAA